MTLDLSIDELLTTTRSVRKRLDLTRPVGREVVERCIEIAVQAPTGSNSQQWQWLVVEEPTLKEQIAHYYAANFDPYVEQSEQSPYPEGDSRNQRAARVRESAVFLRNHLHEVPIMVIPCQVGRVPDDAPTFAHASFYGSILPAAWSFMLALRARGLGSSWTTLHLPNEREVAELVGIPYEQVTQVGLFPVAYTVGTEFKPAPRRPLDEVLHWDRW